VTEKKVFGWKKKLCRQPEKSVRLTTNFRSRPLTIIWCFGNHISPFAGDIPPFIGEFDWRKAYNSFDCIIVGRAFKKGGGASEDG
jgi:hypothetical protein